MRRAIGKVGLWGAVAVLGAAGLIAWVANAGGEPTMRIEHEPLFPDAVVAAWVGFADAIVVVDVEGEREVSGARELQPERGDTGGIARFVDVTVREVAWSSERRDLGVDDRLALRTEGWWLEDGRRSRIVVRGATPLEAGGSYVVALIHDDEGRMGDPGWALLTFHTVARVTGAGTVDLADLGEVDLDELPDALAAIELRPRLAAVSGLDPYERLRRIQSRNREAG